ncbi:MAG: hypothetical protein ACRCST_16925 [Turicibacter sp.]
MFKINQEHKNTQNEYRIEDQLVYMTILNKKGKELIAKFDLEDLETVKECGNWFAEWHKDFNSYLAQCSTKTENNGKVKFIKRSLQSVVLGTSPNAPIKHINGDLLDNQKSNLEIFNRKQQNDYEMLENNVVAVHLKNRYGKIDAKALISAEDLNTVITEKLAWVCQKRSNGQPYAVAHTEEGRLLLDRYLANPGENQEVQHINKNPLDNRRANLKVRDIIADAE